MIIKYNKLPHVEQGNHTKLCYEKANSIKFLKLLISHSHSYIIHKQIHRNMMTRIDYE